MTRIIPLLLLAAVAVAAPDPWFGADKAEHVAVSMGISSTTYIIGAGALGIDHWRTLLGSATVALTVGGAYELWQNRRGGPGGSWKDMVANATGVLITAAITTVLYEAGRD